MIKVGMIGFGGIARLHKAAYDALEEKGVGIKLVSVCDTSLEQFSKSGGINIATDIGVQKHEFNKYNILDDMLAEEKLDIIDICVPTPLHAHLACDMLTLGYNVMSEKPMARTYSQCLDMLKAKDSSGRILMIGQCVRFMPEYAYLKGIVADKTYGSVKSAYFHRLSSPPTWGFKNWLMEPEKSGGCLLDMHIHDLDFARFAFGEPKLVSCTATEVYSKYDTVQSRLYYDGFTVEATGDWGLSPKYKFSAGYRVNFECATVELKDGVITIYPHEEEPFIPDYEKGDYFTNEIHYLADIVSGKRVNTVNPPESAAMSVKLAETLRESADSGKTLEFK